MATSESARSVDTHELMPSDFYPHPSEGGAYSSSQQSVPTFVDDYVVYFGGAFVIVFFVLIILFLSRKNTSLHTKSKRDALPVNPDKKPEGWSQPEYFQLSLCVEGPADADDSVFSSLASRVVREAENLYIPGVNRRDSSDGEFAWSVQTKFPSDKLCGSWLSPGTGWFERPDIIERPVKWLCVCLQYTAETSPATLYSLVDEAGRQVEKSYLKGGHYHGSEGYTFCMSQF